MQAVLLGKGCRWSYSTGLWRSDDQLNHNSQQNDCYEHQEGFTGHHHDDIVPLNHHGNHQNVSLIREQQFTEHMSNSCRCTGDTRYCTCHSCMEYRWRLQRQYYMSRRYHGSMMELAYDPDHDAFHGATPSQNEMGLWRKDTDYDFKITRYESRWQASGSGGYSTFEGLGTQTFPLGSNPAAVVQYPPYQGQGTQHDVFGEHRFYKHSESWGNQRHPWNNDDPLMMMT